MNRSESVQDQTIRDFGEQWTHYPANAGYYASLDMLQDHFGPLMDIADLKAKRVGEIGSGTGRIVRMLLEAGVASVHAFEPSDAFDVLRANLREAGACVTCVRARGDQIPPGLNLDFLCSIGVVHHIPEPLPVVKAAYRALKPGGVFFIWVYGYEGNEMYLRWVLPLRRLTAKLPHGLLMAFCHVINLVLDVYIAVAKRFPLPMRHYINNVIARFSRRNRFLVIYDQLNPAYAKYYRQDEVRELLIAAGFEDIGLYHRHAYSWSAMCRRPVDRASAPN